MKHTPGPWIVEKGQVAPEIYGASDDEHNVVCYAESASYRSNDTVQANAALIAAAPDMLEALIRANRQLEMFEHISESGRTEARNVILAAIAKAKGH